jgi:RNA polymerase sigma-70 factor (ECF subfamily)
MPHVPVLLRMTAALVGTADAAMTPRRRRFLRAWQAAPSLRDEGALRSWLLQIAVHHCRDWHRERYGTRQRLNEPLRARDDDEEIALLAADPGTSDHMGAIDLRLAINAVDRDLRMVVALRYYASMAATEIGATLDVPAATVRTWLRHALTVLRERWRRVGLSAIQYQVQGAWRHAVRPAIATRHIRYTARDRYRTIFQVRTAMSITPAPGHAKGSAMAATTNPVHYLFMRREDSAQPGDPEDWPPAVMQVGSEDVICVAIQVTVTEDGWRAQPLQQVPSVEDIPENALVVTRDTELAFSEGRGGDAVAALLGARVESDTPKEPGLLTQVVILARGGPLPWRVTRPVVVPASALVLSSYAERGGRSEATLDLRLAPSDLGELPVWLPDAAIEPLAVLAVDRAVLSPRARHLIVIEVQAGRVALHGRAELASHAEGAVRELEATPGVLEVVDHLLVDESLQDVVEQALAAKGITGVRALAEHGLISLHGEVQDTATRRQAVDIATDVTGVRGVVNLIEVRATG